MKWSWKIARVAGTDVRIHATFPLLLLWFGVSTFLAGQGLVAALLTVLFVLALFGTIVLHEFGHALTARRFGIRTKDITLLPIGGVARLDRMPEKPEQELLVAVAGPAVNILIAAVLLGGVYLATGTVPPMSVSLTGETFVASLAWVNVALAVFNLIPAFPMDGGRALRAMLALRLDYVRATNIAASLGRAFAVVFAVAGIFGSPILVLIALFIWMGASAETAATAFRVALNGVPVSSAMVTSFVTLAPEDTLGHASDLSMRSFQKDFPVVTQGHLAGMLTHENLLRAIERFDDSVFVSEVMERDCPPVGPPAMLLDVLTRLGERKCRSLPVTDRGQVVGIINLDAVGQLLAIRRFQSRRRPPNRGAGERLRPWRKSPTSH